VFKQWAKVALKDEPKVPFVAPPGIRWARIDRATGRRVYGTFPTTEDPKSPVIWEAFQPQTEPRRAYRRHNTTGQQGAGDDGEKPVATVAARKPARRAPRPTAPAAPPPAATVPAPTPAAALQNGAGIH
jgi:penicillin-binding protein 1A